MLFWALLSRRDPARLLALLPRQFSRRVKLQNSFTAPLKSRIGRHPGHVVFDLLCAACRTQSLDSISCTMRPQALGAVYTGARTRLGVDG